MEIKAAGVIVAEMSLMFAKAGSAIIGRWLLNSKASIPSTAPPSDYVFHAAPLEKTQTDGKYWLGLAKLSLCH